MAVSQGMNHPAVLAVAGRLDTDQQKVAELLQRTTTAVSTLGQNWFGKDSTQFASDWAAHSKQLHLAADGIAAGEVPAVAATADAVARLARER